jgi:hypothetical protein
MAEVLPRSADLVGVGDVDQLVTGVRDQVEGDPGEPHRGKIGPAPLPSDAKCRIASGTTAWTAELAFSLLISAVEMVAEIALIMW